MTLYHHENGRLVLHALPVLLAALAVLAVAYRYYSAFLAAKVAALDDTRPTPAHRLADGQNYQPTNRWVVFGHHFAAISGAGPLIGPVLAIQYGYMPGLIWLILGVCFAGAVQDMLVLAASVRRDGKSLAEIARHELGEPAAVVASVAILVIVVIALAGLGFVVVKALGGEEAKLPPRVAITLPVNGNAICSRERQLDGFNVWEFPAGCAVRYAAEFPPHVRSEAFVLKVRVDPRVAFPDYLDLSVGAPADPKDLGRVTEANCLAMTVDWTGVIGFLSPADPQPGRLDRWAERVVGRRIIGRSERLWEKSVSLWRPWSGGAYDLPINAVGVERVVLPAGCTQVIPGSSWGTFTIAATIPIALFVGLWMHKLRPGRVVEASLIGGALVLAAVVLGGYIPGSPAQRFFSLTRDETVITITGYGFVAAVLPVWLLLGPRDYLSSFLKIGTVILLIGSILIANPPLQAPALNEVFLDGGPTFAGNLFPFVFICVMCGAVSGFHALVASGTTPKMIDKESQIRGVGYGAMLMECAVGITALIAAATLPPDLYYDINIPIDRAQQFQPQVADINSRYGADPLHAANVNGVGHLDLGTVEAKVGGESLRGRTGGAVTLAVGMSVIFERAFVTLGVTGDWLLKYWYHFAIMFEALFILTTIDAGTRIGRFLMQETLGRLYAPFSRPDWLPGSLLASAVITGSWGWLIHTGSIDTIWPMFGVANQLLAVLALALVTTWLVNNDRGRFIWVTLPPMLFVMSTTLTAGTILVTERFPAMYRAGQKTPAVLNTGLTLFVMCAVLAVVALAAARCGGVLLGRGKAPR